MPHEYFKKLEEKPAKNMNVRDLEENEIKNYAQKIRIVKLFKLFLNIYNQCNSSKNFPGIFVCLLSKMRVAIFLLTLFSNDDCELCLLKKSRKKRDSA